MTDQDQPQTDGPKADRVQTGAPLAPPATQVAPADPAPVDDPVAPAAVGPADNAASARTGGGGRAFAGAVAGGVLALAAGFAVSHYDLAGLRPAPDTSALTALEARISAAETANAASQGTADRALSELGPRIEALENSTTLPAAGMDDLAAQVADLTDRLAALDSMLAGLSTAPSGEGGASPAQVAALAAAVESLRGQLAGLQSAPDDAAIRAIAADEIAAWEQAATDRLQQERASAEAATARAVALQSLAQAADSGTPFAELLPVLGADLPDAIARHADAGLPPLTTGFAEAARRALETARRAAPGDSLGDRFLSFLMVQTGARSLTPQEGDTADAILSRAEAAVAQGNAQAALAEIAALPPEAQAEMAEWQQLAQARVAFADALTALAMPAAPLSPNPNP